MYRASTSNSGAAVGLSSSSLVKTPGIVSKLHQTIRISAWIISISLAVCTFNRQAFLFSWHPVFMSVGFILFMTEGVLSAIMFRQLDGPERVKAIQSHALLQLRAVLCIIVGFIVIYRNKVIHNKEHFKSVHGKFGLATFILSILAPLGGVISFRKLGYIQKLPEPLQPLIKWLHRQIGVITWLAALVTIELALPHKSVNKGLLTTAWQIGVGAIGGAMLLLHVKARNKLKENLDGFAKVT